jgi:CBS domain-containing protein
MYLRDVMNRNVRPISPDTVLERAARFMSHLKVSLLPVCEDGKVVGVITPRDLIVRATAQGCDPRTSTAQEVMTRRVVCVRENQRVEEAARFMLRHRLSRMPVVDRHQHLVGTVCFADLYGKNIPQSQG